MSFRRVLGSAAIVLAFAAGFAVRGIAQPTPVLHAAAADRVFEMRTYTASGGKFDALKARFKDNTIRFFNKHNMTSIGYWTPMDGTGLNTTIVYLLAFPSREAADASWAAFNADPDWVKVRNESNVGGNIVAKADRQFMTPLEFSPIK